MPVGSCSPIPWMSTTARRTQPSPSPATGRGGSVGVVPQVVIPVILAAGTDSDAGQPSRTPPR
ncbi:hypothetical protein BJF86_15855 [Serinicoccus sp. CNJ-927]|nr:hypothetical protein BJF86_15855 [Serinicoccus sp. CNJ-927]